MSLAVCRALPKAGEGMFPEGLSVCACRAAVPTALMLCRCGARWSPLEFAAGSKIPAARSAVPQTEPPHCAPITRHTGGFVSEG